MLLAASRTRPVPEAARWLETVAKVRRLGAGAGLLAGGAVLAVYATGVLTVAGILALATVLPPWAAALGVAGVLPPDGNVPAAGTARPSAAGASADNGAAHPQLGRVTSVVPARSRIRAGTTGLAARSGGRSQGMFEGFAVDDIDMGDVRLRVRRVGNGPAVVLLCPTLFVRSLTR